MLSALVFISQLAECRVTIGERPFRELGDSLHLREPIHWPAASIGNCTNFQMIYFVGNNFNGTIPPTIGRLKQISLLLHVRQNYLSGPMPPEWGSWVGTLGGWGRGLSVKESRSCCPNTKWRIIRIHQAGNYPSSINFPYTDVKVKQCLFLSLPIILDTRCSTGKRGMWVLIHGCSPTLPTYLVNYY